LAARNPACAALKTLAEKGLVNYEPYSYITLTDKGKKSLEQNLTDFVKK